MPRRSPTRARTRARSDRGAAIAGVAWNHAGLPPAAEAGAAPATFPRRMRAILRIDTLMAGQLLYRDPDLTLERLARRAGIPARRISGAVNRVPSPTSRRSSTVPDRSCQAAARLELADPVTSIMLEAGFARSRTSPRVPADHRHDARRLSALGEQASTGPVGRQRSYGFRPPVPKARPDPRPSSIAILNVREQVQDALGEPDGDLPPCGVRLSCFASADCDGSRPWTVGGDENSELVPAVIGTSRS